MGQGADGLAVARQSDGRLGWGLLLRADHHHGHPVELSRDYTPCVAEADQAVGLALDVCWNRRALACSYEMQLSAQNRSSQDL
ncbi:hypothetical protein GCM10007047_34140 [Cerasicoccus arenae]|uniref:Uncharacterized protein n=1 Tax=Cerasicoccus arenae TaxID=424488 RepID=A0A8J3DN67_9BACT|nr:hypothetical protein GCM10007047_34140 [Cerasicoccus arenae]